MPIKANANTEDNLIYPELSYKLIGLSFKVYNQLGYGHQEKYFQRAYANELTREKISFEREKEIKLWYNGECIGKYFLDFIIGKKIVVEFKVIPNFRHIHLKQTLEYLQTVNLKLAILIYFTRDGVKYRRIVNPKFKVNTF